MAGKNARHIAQRLLQKFGMTFVGELGVEIRDNTPSALYRLLCFASLAAKRINHRTAVKAAKALVENGWTNPAKMARATWERRTWVLNRSGYARYDESTSRYLGQTARMLLEKYAGDLRKLRQAADGNPTRLRELLQEFKGIGPVGVDIFFREAQAIWRELFPFADQKALKAAATLGLPRDAKGLAVLVRRKDYPRLVAALVRVQLENKFDDISESGKEKGRKARPMCCFRATTAAKRS